MSKKDKRSWKDLNRKEIELAQQKYNEYQSVAAIADHLNIPRTTLTYHIRVDGWDTAREMRKAELYTMWSASKKQKFINMSSDAARIIQKSLNHLANRQEPPTPREAKDAVAILEALDKITRLDDGKPTEITEEKVMELKDIESIAEMIPFKSKDTIVYKEEDEEDEKAN